MIVLRRSVAALTIVACCTTLLLVHRYREKQRLRNEQLKRDLLLQIQRFKTENQMLRGIIASSRAAAALPRSEFLELLRLRSEVGRLRSLARENQNSVVELEELRRGLQQLDAEKKNGQNEPLALLEEQEELRQARLDRLNEWLRTHPKEFIPELRLLGHESWIRSADQTPVTEEDYSQWISSQRNQAVKNFSADAFKALKSYMAEHQGEFPSTVSELKPYFRRPVDDDLLERYEMAPAKSLASPLSEAGGDWVITQKPELGKPLETRVAIGSSRFYGTTANGSWGGMQ